MPDCGLESLAKPVPELNLMTYQTGPDDWQLLACVCIMCSRQQHQFQGSLHQPRPCAALKYFGVCRLAAQAALVELIEEQGLPPVCAALAVAEDADTQLGRVLAQAVQVR